MNEWKKISLNKFRDAATAMALEWYRHPSQSLERLFDFLWKNLSMVNAEAKIQKSWGWTII